MDVFLLPSLYRGLPVVGIETQAAGLPLIVSSAVTEEINLTGPVTRMRLEQGAPALAEKALLFREYPRSAAAAANNEKVRPLYGIEENAPLLQEFYLSKHHESS